MKYNFKKNPDGSYTVFGVPIFQLGTHRGFSYDNNWSQKLINNHSALEKQDWLPPIIIGHNDFRDIGEKPANGFLKNIRVENGLVVADFQMNTQQDFDLLKELKFPYRSIEVYNEDAKISAVALLGGTEPYFKFPMLIVGKDEGNYCAYSSDEEFELQESTQTGKQVFSNIKEAVNTITAFFNKTTDQNSQEEETMDREAFKAKYGYYPEEANSFKEENERLKTQLQEKAFTTFKAELSQSNIAPAVVELIENSNFKNNQDFHILIKEILKYAGEGNLIIDTTEHIKNNRNSNSTLAEYAKLTPEDLTEKAEELFLNGKFNTYAESLSYVKEMNSKACQLGL